MQNDDTKDVGLGRDAARVCQSLGATQPFNWIAPSDWSPLYESACYVWRGLTLGQHRVQTVHFIKYLGATAKPY